MDQKDETTPVSTPRASVFDCETLARLAISCAKTRESSEAIEWMWGAIRRAEASRMSVSEWLTGTSCPASSDFGKAGRSLPDGRKVVWSTDHEPSNEHRMLASYCLTGAIADPAHFWNFCRHYSLAPSEVKNLAKFASMTPYGKDASKRKNGLIALASRYGIPAENTLRLRLWW